MHYFSLFNHCASLKISNIRLSSPLSANPMAVKLLPVVLTLRSEPKCKYNEYWLNIIVIY